MKRISRRASNTCFGVLIIFAGLGACADQQIDSAFFPIEQDRLWGVIDNKGKVIVEPSFETASSVPLHKIEFRNIGQESVVMVGKEKWLYVTKNGVEVIEPPVQEDCVVSNRGNSLFAVFVSADLMTNPVTPSVVLDPFGLWKPPKDVDIFGVFSDGLIAVHHNGKIGYADRCGRIVIEPKFDAVGHFDFSDGCFRDGLATAKVGEKWGYVDRKGTWALEPQYRQVTPFDQGFAIVFPFNDDAAPVVINHEGKTICEWLTAPGTGPVLRGSVLIEGLSLVRDRTSDLLGFVDHTTTWKMPPAYRIARPFHDGLAPVVAQKRDESGFIDHEGRIVVAVPEARDLYWFSKGLAFVKTLDGHGYIDRSGIWVWRVAK